MKFNIF